MESIYWIQRLGALSKVCGIITVVGFVVLVLLSLNYISESDSYFKNEDTISLLKSIIRKVIAVLVVSTLGLVFIPSTKELYTIYGIGGAIDYIMSNDHAKQLPDKVINALDAWVEKTIEEHKDK